MQRGPFELLNRTWDRSGKKNLIRGGQEESPLRKITCRCPTLKDKGHLTSKETLSLEKHDRGRLFRGQKGVQQRSKLRFRENAAHSRITGNFSVGWGETNLFDPGNVQVQEVKKKPFNTQRGCRSEFPFCRRGGYRRRIVLSFQLRRRKGRGKVGTFRGGGI